MTVSCLREKMFQAYTFNKIIIILAVPVVTEAFVVAVADAAITSGTLGLLDGPHHPGGEGGAHEGRLPPARRLVLGDAVVDDGVGDGLVGAHPVTHLAPSLPLVLGLKLDTRPLDPEPDEDDMDS